MKKFITSKIFTTALIATGAFLIGVKNGQQVKQYFRTKKENTARIFNAIKNVAKENNNESDIIITEGDSK